VHPKAARVRHIEQKVFTVAADLGLPDERVQALIQPPPLSWPRHVLATEPPRLDADIYELDDWLDRMLAALSELPEDGEFVVHPESRGRVDGWMRRALQRLLDAEASDDLETAFKQAWLVARFHAVFRRLSAVEAYEAPARLYVPGPLPERRPM